MCEYCESGKEMEIYGACIHTFIVNKKTRCSATCREYSNGIRCFYKLNIYQLLSDVWQKPKECK